MVDHADQMGTQVTTKGDARVTKLGKETETLQIGRASAVANILTGDMTFVGTRPEVEKYVRYYTNEMKATLLLPAGVTSMTSIEYKDEERLLQSAEDADEVYIQTILPEKMRYNLEAIEKFSFFRDIATMFATVKAVTGK